MSGVTEGARDEITHIRQLSMQLVQLPDRTIIAWNHYGRTRPNRALESCKGVQPRIGSDTSDSSQLAKDVTTRTESYHLTSVR